MSGSGPAVDLVLLDPDTGTAPLAVESSRGLQAVAGRRGSKSWDVQLQSRALPVTQAGESTRVASSAPLALATVLTKFRGGTKFSQVYNDQ